MKALDTNVLVRFLINDDKSQGRKARILFEDAERSGDIALARRGLVPAVAAEFLIDCGEGLKGRSLTPEVYTERLENLVAMALCNWRSIDPPRS